MPDGATTPEFLKNVLLTREKLKDDLSKLDKEIDEAKLKPARDVASEVAKTEKINRDQAVQRFNSWKADNERLITQGTALKHFLAIYEEEINDADPELIVPILDALILSLRGTYSREKGEADAVNKRIEELEREKAKKVKASSKSQAGS